MNALNSIKDSLSRLSIQIFRWVVHLFRLDLPRFFQNGGAIHRVWAYSLVGGPLPLTAKPSLIHDKRIFGISILNLRKAGWISLKSKTNHQLHKTELELQIEPRNWQGRLLLKLNQKKANRLLSIWNRSAYDAALRPAKPRSESNLFLIFHLLCQFRATLRFSNLFLLPIKKSESSFAPFQSNGISWFLSAELYFNNVYLDNSFFNNVSLGNGWQLPAWLKHISKRFQNLKITNLQLIQVSTTFNGHLLHGFLLYDGDRDIERHIHHLQNHYIFNFKNQYIRLKPAKYGGFEADFPFKDASQNYYLFHETEDGQIHGYGFQSSYPANHLQRFLTQVIPKKKTLQRANPCREKNLILPIDQSQEIKNNQYNNDHKNNYASPFSIYVSRLELNLVDYFVTNQTELLWRPELVSPPVELPVII